MHLPRTSLLLNLIAGLIALSAGKCSSDGELYRIRIGNRRGGLVQVSLDAGKTYRTVGRVKVAANARITGFAAASFAPRGTVAAVAVHGIRVKTGQAAIGIGKSQQPLMFSITPIEFSAIPNNYGGHVPRSSGIVTDIHAGHSIFRNQAPYVGSPVFIERDGGLEVLPEDYTPTGSETFVIVVNAPDDAPASIEFENHPGGAVTVVRRDGAREKLTEVVRPVLGVGRFDGTTFTGAGSINTNHPGVITIGTAPLSPTGTKEGGPVETRGGFMIQPSYHVKEQGESSPQVMVVGPMNPARPVLEGRPPLFSRCISLSRFPGYERSSCRVQVRIDDGDWEPLPAIAGRVDDAFTAAYLTAHFANKVAGSPGASPSRERQVRRGVTALRIVLPEYSAKLVARDLARQSEDYTKEALRAGVRPVRGTISLSPKLKRRRGCPLYFYIDGSVAGASSGGSHGFEWDTTRVPNGFHEIAIVAAPENAEPQREVQHILVLN